MWGQSCPSGTPQHDLSWAFRRAFVDVIKTRILRRNPSGLRWALSPTASILKTEEKGRRHRDTGRRQCEGTELRPCLQATIAEECQQPPQATETGSGFSAPLSFQKDSALPTPRSWTSGLQACGGIHSGCFKWPILWSLVMSHVEKSCRRLKAPHKSAGGSRNGIVEVGKVLESRAQTPPPLSFPFYLGSELAWRRGCPFRSY